jgi:hypothetical protein
VPPIDVVACSTCFASARSCAERVAIGPGCGCAVGGLGHRSPGAECVGVECGGSVGAGDAVDVAGASLGAGVGLVSVGDGLGVGHGSVGEGSDVGLGSVGEGSGVGLGVGVGVGVGSVGEGSGVGLGSVGEGVGVGVGVGGLSVGAHVSARDDEVVGSIWATARPPSASPKAAVAASAARTQARRLTALARRPAAVTRPAVDLATMASLRSRSSTLSRRPYRGPGILGATDDSAGSEPGAEENGPRTRPPPGADHPPG